MPLDEFDLLMFMLGADPTIKSLRTEKYKTSRFPSLPTSPLAAVKVLWSVTQIQQVRTFQDIATLPTVHDVFEWLGQASLFFFCSSGTGAR